MTYCVDRTYHQDSLELWLETFRAYGEFEMTEMTVLVMTV